MFTSTTTNAKTITLNDLKEMLYYLDPNLDYVEWFQVLAGAKYELGDNAEDICREWSQGTDANPCYKYNDRAFNATWRSLSTNKLNPITIKTVFYLAKRAGWRCDDVLLTSKTANANADSADLKEETTDPEVIEEALELLCNSTLAIADHPYLKEKRIKQHGLRKLDSRRGEADVGALIVPVYDKNFMIQGVQFVSTTNKAYLTGTRPKGCFYCFDGEKDLMYVCEGLATAATINEVTGKMTFITFGYGNLEAATLNIQQAFPDAKLVIAADNNVQPVINGKTKNPGVDAARKIFNKHNIPYTYPLFKDKQGKGYADFNDLCKHYGTDEVSEQLVDNLVENSIAFTEFNNPNYNKNGTTIVADEQDSTKVVVDDNIKDGADKIASNSVDDRVIVYTRSKKMRFVSDKKRGLVCEKLQTSGKTDEAGKHLYKDVETTYISGDLRITAKLTNENQEGRLFRAEFIDDKNIPHQCDFQCSLLGSRGNEIFEKLLEIGLDINLESNPGMNPRQLLYCYISAAMPKKYLRYVTKTGLIKRESKFAYVLSNKVLGLDDADEQVVFINSFITENTTNIAQKGTLDEWKENIGRFCKNNTRLIFACCSSFASPFAGVLSKELNGIHYFGESSSGKTSSLKVAASIWGTPRFMGQWLTTANAAEGFATMRSNLPMILDELSQAKPKEVGSMIYMVSQGKTKGRATTDGSCRKIVEFKTNIISSGEISIASFMASADEKPKAGQEIRLVDIQADAGKGLQRVPARFVRKYNTYVI